MAKFIKFKNPKPFTNTILVDIDRVVLVSALVENTTAYNDGFRTNLEMDKSTKLLSINIADTVEEVGEMLC